MRYKSEETMEKIIRAIEDFYFSRFRSPSIGEIASEVGCAKSTVHSYLWEMDRRGLLSYDGRTAETPVTRKADAGFVLSPVLGSISCGELEYAEEGEIVVALVDNETTLKRFYTDKKRRCVRLHPENRAMQDIYTDHCHIQGVAQQVIKQLT